jgi:polyferredoxin
MDRLGRPRGLIRYDSPDGLAGKSRRIVRPRIVLYSVLLAIGAVVALVATHGRRDFEATLLRLPGEPYVVDDGVVRNALQVHLVNKRDQAADYHVTVDAAEGLTSVVPMASVRVAALADARVPIFLSVPRGAFAREFTVRVRVAHDGEAPAIVTATFLGPERP